jgi:hypothetical protein
MPPAVFWSQKNRLTFKSPCKGLSSIEPHDARGQIDGGQKVARRLIIAGGNGTELFDLSKEILDQMACVVEMMIVAPRGATVCFWRNHGSFAGCRQRFEDALRGVESFVADQNVRLHVGQQVIGADQIMGLTTAEVKANRVAERIG